MKKVAGVLLAFVLCLSLSLGAFAVEPQVDDSLVADIVDGIGDLVEAESEGDSEAVKKAIDKLYADLQTARQSGDISAVIDLAAEYAENENDDAKVIFASRGAVKNVFEKFMVDGGYGTDKIMKDLRSGSALNTLVSLYTGGYVAPATTTAAIEEGAEPTVNEFQPEVENPSTGDSLTSVTVAFGVLAVSTVAAVVLSKKKEQ